MEVTGLLMGVARARLVSPGGGARSPPRPAVALFLRAVSPGGGAKVKVPLPVPPKPLFLLGRLVDDYRNG